MLAGHATNGEPLLHPNVESIDIAPTVRDNRGEPLRTGECKPIERLFRPNRVVHATYNACRITWPRLMASDRYVLLGLAHPRSPWFSSLAHWATAASIPAELVKCVSPEELPSCAKA